MPYGGVFRFEAGARLRVRSVSYLSPSIAAWAYVQYSDGTEGYITIPPGGEYAGPTPLSGWVLGGCVYLDGGDVWGGSHRRGATWAYLVMERASGAGGQGGIGGSPLCAGYLHAAQPMLLLGTFETPGPGGGSGYLRAIASVVDAAGNAASTTADISLAPGGGGYRMCYGFIIYYDTTGVATRTIAPQIRTPISAALPTGFGGTGIAWQGATLSLTSGEEGVYYVFAKNAREGFVSTNDNGTLAYANTASAPSPFPFWLAGDAESAALNPNIGAGLAADRWSLYLLVEDWIYGSV